MIVTVLIEPIHRDSLGIINNYVLDDKGTIETTFDEDGLFVHTYKIKTPAIGINVLLECWRNPRIKAVSFDKED